MKTKFEQILDLFEYKVDGLPVLPVLLEIALTKTSLNLSSNQRRFLIDLDLIWEHPPDKRKFRLLGLRPESRKKISKLFGLTSDAMIKLYGEIQ